MLAHPGHPGLGTLGDSGHLDRVAGQQHRTGNPVGAGHGHHHVALFQVRVGHHLARGQCRPGHQVLGGQGPGHLVTGPAVHPGLDGRQNHVGQVASPSAAVGESGIGSPSRTTDQVGQALELGLPHELEDHVAVGTADRCDHEGCRLGFPLDPQRVEVHHQVSQGDRRIEHGQVDVLT